MQRTAIVMSGLPASGKSSLGRLIADHFRLALFDKDDYLERLYEGAEVAGLQERRTLSRQSDREFQDHAVSSETSAVLVSHWCTRASPAGSGTPTEWISASYHKIVEVCCICDPETATRRFFARRRHPGHLDRLRDRGVFAAQMRELKSGLPLGIGHTVSVETDGKVDCGPLLDELGDLVAKIS